MAFNRNRSGGDRGGFRPRPSFGGGRPRFGDRGDSPRFAGGAGRGPVEMHDAICDNCGKSCQVPFRPTSGKPIFCSECFEQKRGGDSRRPEPRFEPQPANNRQLDEINAKLDTILKLLEKKKPSKTSE